MQKQILYIYICCFLPTLVAAQVSQDPVLQPRSIEEVVVTGQFEPISIKNSVYKVRSINQDQIRRRSTTDITTLLNTELGVRFSNDLTLGESDIQLMGMSGQNVKILIDGVPLLDRGATKQSLSQIDLNTVEKIEIVEGPVSVIYGTDALAGVINIITRKQDGIKSRWNLQARLLEETVEQEYTPFTKEGKHNAHLGLDYEHNGWQASATGSRNNFGGWQGDKSGRELTWQPKDQWLGSARLGYAKNNVDTWYRLDYTNEDIYTPGRYNPNNTYIDKNYITRRWTHILQSNWKLSPRWSFNGALSYQDYERETVTKRTNLETQTSELTTGAGEQDIANFNNIFFRGTAQFRPSDVLHFQAGLEYDFERGSGERIHQTPEIQEYAAFLSAEYQPLTWLQIRPGVRFLHNSIYDAPPVIPSINTLIQLSPAFQLRSAYARGFRSPALRELFFTFFDSNHSIRGNENLKAEYFNSFNSYLSYTRVVNDQTHITSSFGGFYNIFENLITTGTDPQDGSVTTYLNLEHFKTTGIVWENSYTHKNLSTTLGFSYLARYNRLNNEFDDTDTFLWTPEVNASVFYDFPSIGMDINLFYKFYGKRPNFEAVIMDDGTVQARATSISSFNQADLSINKRLTNYLTLNGGIRNLLDVKNVTSTATVGESAHSGPATSIPMSFGRSYFLGLQFNISR